MAVVAGRRRRRARRALLARHRPAPGSRVYSRMPPARTVSTSSCIRPASSSSRITKPGTARGLELVHVGGAVGIDPRQQRHDGRQLREIVPVDRDAGRARHRDPVDQVVGRAAGGQQRGHRVDDGALVDQLADRREALGLDDAQHRAHGLARELVAQFGARIDEGRARHVQAHRFHQHLVAVGGAVEGAGARRVVGRASRHRAGPARPTRPCAACSRTLDLSLLDRPLGIGPAGTNTVGRWPKCSAPISRPGTILSQMPSSSAASNTSWLSATAVRHRDHVAARTGSAPCRACPA